MESMQTLSSLTGLPLFAIALVVLWSLAWKGFALWRAAELRQKGWFVALLIVNTLGLFEIMYLFVVARRYKVLVEVIEERG